MAFNPFEAFSVRSKLGRSVMAVLGIVVMLTFVLSTGAVGSGNDFFDQIGNVFSSGKRGEVVATAYGDDVRDTEISDIHRQRRVAREFFARATDVSYTRWAEALSNDVKSGRVTNETRLAVEPFANLRMNAEAKPQPYGQFLNEFFQFQSDAQKRYGDALMRARAKPDSEDKKALDAMAAIILYDKRAMPPIFPVMELAGDSDREAMDFLLLLKKADKMGIQYSEDAVMNLLGRDTSGRVTPADFEKIGNRFRRNDNPKAGVITSDYIVSALANEYRARAVLTALQGKSVAAEMSRQIGIQRLGQLERIIMDQFLRINLFELPAPGDRGLASAFPGGVTPYEFFDYYKDRCTENTFAVLEVDAKKFLKQVTGEPTAAERNELFKKYKGELPDPSRDRPGFREPKKLKVEFVTLDANAPRITQAIPKLQAASLFLCASGGAIAGNPAMALTAATQPAIAETLPLRTAVAEKMDPILSPYGMREVFYFEPRDTSIYRPQPIVSALGILSGLPDIGTFTAAAVSVHQNVERIDHHTRVPFLLQPVLTPFNPTLANALGMPAFAYSLNPKLPPESLYLPQALAAVKKNQRQELFQADVKELQEKLRKITADVDVTMGVKPEKAKVEKAQGEARKLIDAWVKDRGLTLGASTEPRDQYAIVTDPGLKTLNDLAIPEPDGTNSLSQKLFAGGDPRARMGSDVQPFHPDWFPSDPTMGLDQFSRSTGLDKPSHLVWVSQEIEAAKPFNNLENADKLTNKEMTKRVDDAWRLEKARALAKAEADKLAEQVRAISKTVATDPLGVERQLRDLAVQQDVRLFDLTGMAPMKFDHGTSPQDIRYKAPTIERTQVLYPAADFTGKLLELRKEPLGTVTVLPDAPRQRYYVACVVARSEKTVDSFRSVFDKSNTTLGRNPLYTQAVGEERFKAVDEVFDRLRAEAGLDLKDAFKNGEKRDSEDR